MKIRAKIEVTVSDTVKHDLDITPRGNGCYYTGSSDTFVTRTIGNVTIDAENYSAAVFAKIGGKVVKVETGYVTDGKIEKDVEWYIV